MHHSSTSTYTSNFIKIEETFGRTQETGFIRSTRRSRPKKQLRSMAEHFKAQLQAD